MKTVSKLFASLLVMSLLIVYSCAKDGNTGPAGPKGDTGATGASGSNGTNGNANVTSQTSTVSTWTWDATNSYSYGNLFVNGLTLDICDKGAVLVYLQTTAGEWAPLARTVYASPTVNISQRFAYSLNSLKIIVQRSDFTQQTMTPIVFKIVCISANGLSSNPNVNLKDYEEVKTAYDL